MPVSSAFHIRLGLSFIIIITFLHLFSMLAWVRRVYLMANFHSNRFWANSCDIFSSFRLPLTTSSQVLHGLPLPRFPSTTISLHIFTQQSVPILSTCPNHLSLLFFKIATYKYNVKFLWLWIS